MSFLTNLSGLEKPFGAFYRVSMLANYPILILRMIGFLIGTRNLTLKDLTKQKLTELSKNCIKKRGMTIFGGVCSIITIIWRMNKSIFCIKLSKWLI
jgi:hypothetical protein